MIIDYTVPIIYIWVVMKILSLMWKTVCLKSLQVLFKLKYHSTMVYFRVEIDRQSLDIMFAVYGLNWYMCEL